MNVALTLIVVLTLTLFGVAEAQEGKLSIFGHLSFEILSSFYNELLRRYDCNYYE